MSDPAVEAAARAFAQIEDDDLTYASERDKTALIAAAREALAPIRELHKRAYLNDNPYEPAEWDCGECETHWPCATAKLIYPSEEL